MKILVFPGDLGGCYTYRIDLPLRELRRFGVEYTLYPFLPSQPGVDQINLLADVISGYDIVILQRCSVLSIARAVKTVCEFLGKPLVFETDDDYLHIPRGNPAYYVGVPKKTIKSFIKEDGTISPEDLQTLEAMRIKALQEYTEIIGMADLVTVTTEELKRTLYPYNKNIVVLPNNVEMVFPYRDSLPQSLFAQDGKLVIEHEQNMWRFPSYFEMEDKFVSIPRIGYSGTISHIGEDFNTIKEGLSRALPETAHTSFYIYLGERSFYNWHVNEAERLTKEGKIQHHHTYFIPADRYEYYRFHLRLLDIGLAPLAPNIFNMSKSDIKAVELAAWGVPCILPNLVTYNRTFTHGKDCLMYNNAKEFAEALELLSKNVALRFELGKNAFNYVKNNRLESQHAERRYSIYKRMVDDAYPLKIFTPKEKINGLDESKTTA